MNKIPKTLAGSDCPMVLSEEFIAVGDDNVCIAPIIAGKDILKFVQRSKNIIDVDFNDEKEISNAAPVPKSSEMRSILKIKRSYLDTHFIGEMNNKMDDIKQFLLKI
ncbi:hypothetical protein TNCV_645561 [Trichonephila clavipes]|nr:hypothetical protein TNCV_645561 [Trichonephila clavipes]